MNYRSDLEVMVASDHPDHHTIGRFFRFTPFGRETQTYFCDSWVENAGYWMTNVADPSDRRNVSERAIGRTYHLLRNDFPTEQHLTAEAIRLYKKNVVHLKLDPLKGL